MIAINRELIRYVFILPIWHGYTRLLGQLY
jgi:hypothetical protein